MIIDRESGHVLVGSSNGDVALLKKADGKVLDEKKRLLDDRISQIYFYWNEKYGIRDASANFISVSIKNEKIEIDKSIKQNLMRSCNISKNNVDIARADVYPHPARVQNLYSPHAVVPSTRSATVAIDFDSDPYSSYCYYVVDETADLAYQHKVIKISKFPKNTIRIQKREAIIHVALSFDKVFQLTSTGRLLVFSMDELIDKNVKDPQSIEIRRFSTMPTLPIFCLPTHYFPSDRQQLFYVIKNTLFIEQF